jgi:16S rRNA (cytosine1402-N4)-methyltransferase
MEQGQKLSHAPVLLEECIEGLAIQSDGLYIDGTFGRGGHSAAVLGRLSESGRLLALDRDAEAVGSANALALAQDRRFRIAHARFGELGELVSEAGWVGRVSGILLDLGVSSPQLDDGGRGFSFMRDGPLDMRMDQSQGMTAEEWLAVVSEAELCRVLKEYGEERYARRIARAIVDRRSRGALVSTAQLAAVIAASMPRREKGQHPATRSFQAIRIQINQELADIQAALEQAVDLLAAGGRLVVIAFHSLEDRIVKRFLRDESRGGTAGDSPLGWPNTAEWQAPRLRRVGRAIRAGAGEIGANLRARSAVLRIAERLPS